MAYLGNDLQVAFPTYRNIDDISSSFNGVLTSFPLTVSGVAPIPAPINSQQCLISVNGVVQRPDDSGTEGFRLSGGNIIFASAPAGGVDFFGVILAGADYVNAGANFPSGTAAVPSITFDSDLDTGVYNPAANQLGITTGGTARLIIDASGQIRANSLGSASAPVITFNSDPNTGIYSPGADQVAISTNGTGRLFVDASGRVGLGTSSPAYVLDVINANFGVSFANSMNWNYPGLILRRNASNASTIKMLSMMLNGDSESDTVLTNYLNIWGTYSGTPTTGSTTSSLSGVMNFGAPNALAFHTNTSERARIDSSGRLLVGTSTARANFFNSTISAAILLEGAGITPAQRFLSVVNNYATDGDGGGVISLCRSKGGTVGSNTLVGSASGDQLGALNFQGNDGTEFVVGARIEAYTDGTCGANDLPSRLVFSTTADGASSPTERMRISSDGTVIFGATPSATTAGVQINPLGFIFASANSSQAGFYNRNTSDGPVVELRKDNVTVGTISVTASATAYNTSSDYRLKEKVVPLTGAADRVKQLKPSQFSFIADPGKTVDGFLAHEAQAVVPECVTGIKDEVDADGNPVYQGIDQSKLVPLLTAALQEALQKIEDLEGRLTAAGI